MKKILLVLSSTAAMAVAVSAFAIPTSEEVYRNNDIGVVVYKDGMDQKVFWYLPPVRLHEISKTVVSKRAKRPTAVDYYFYIQPYMTKDLEQFLAGEITGLTNRSQLRPLKISKIRILINQFAEVSETEQVTDFQYINRIHPVKFSVPGDRAEEFDTFINSKPGIHAYMMFFYETERMDKWLTADLSCKEVYDSLNINVSGQYSFLKGDIEVAISSLFESKYAKIRSKGDLPIPDAVTNAISQCFTTTTVKKPRSSSNSTMEAFGLAATSNFEDQLYESMRAKERSMELGAEETLDDFVFDLRILSNEEDETSGDGEAKIKRKKSVPKELKFTFKKELARSTRLIFFEQKHYVDDHEAVAIPFYLSKIRAEEKYDVTITPIAVRNFVVNKRYESDTPLSTGIEFRENEQYVINSTFNLLAKSHYSDYKPKWYRWDSKWPDVSNDLYYRIGEGGEWTSVGKRMMINANTLNRGELQLFIDRQRIWEKVPADFKESYFLGFIEPIWEYKNFFPQFDITVSGRRVTFSSN